MQRIEESTAAETGGGYYYQKGSDRGSEEAGASGRGGDPAEANAMASKWGRAANSLQAALAIEAPVPAVREGWLLKGASERPGKAPGAERKWRERWASLKDGCLLLYPAEKAPVPRGVLRVASHDVEVADAAGVEARHLPATILSGDHQHRRPALGEYLGGFSHRWSART